MKNETVKTAEIAAGDKISWKLDTPVYHAGPVSMFMSKVEDASEADGSTKWFKIQDVGPSFSGKGGNWEATLQRKCLNAIEILGVNTTTETFAVTVPSCIPTGDYLMRVQQTAIHVSGGDPQFHVSCAQLKVMGEGKDWPSASHMIDIPGAFKATDPGYKVNIFVNFKEYEMPGPPVYAC